MTAKSNYLENKVLDHVLGKGARNFTSPANLYVSLHTADPAEDATGTEASGGSYTRQSATFAAASGGSASNSAAIEFLNLAAATYTHAAVWDASTAGNMLYYGPLAAAQTVAAGGNVRFSVGQLVISEG